MHLLNLNFTNENVLMIVQTEFGQDGLDCEWVGNNSTALLQLAVFSDSGTKCYLFRLQKFDDKIFELLNNILNENSIIKLGVGIDGDYKRLLAEGFVDVTKYSFLDLRFLAVQRVG